MAMSLGEAADGSYSVKLYLQRDRSDSYYQQTLYNFEISYWKANEPQSSAVSDYHFTDVITMYKWGPPVSPSAGDIVWKFSVPRMSHIPK